MVISLFPTTSTWTRGVLRLEPGTNKWSRKLLAGPPLFEGTQRACYRESALDDCLQLGNTLIQLINVDVCLFQLVQHGTYLV